MKSLVPAQEYFLLFSQKVVLREKIDYHQLFIKHYKIIIMGSFQFLVPKNCCQKQNSYFTHDALQELLINFKKQNFEKPRKLVILKSSPKPFDLVYFNETCLFGPLLCSQINLQGFS